MILLNVGDSVVTLVDVMVQDATGNPVVLPAGSAGTIESFSYPGGTAQVAFPGVRTVLHFKPGDIVAA